MPGQANPYAPTLGDILPYVQQDTKSRVNAIDFTNEINTATNFANNRMAENERERVAHRQAMKEAYASVDPSKLSGTLETDKPILMEKIMGVLDVLQNDPSAISNPNSKGYVDFQKNYSDAMKSIYTSKMRKLKVDGDTALMEENPDFKTDTNKTKIDWYKNNFDANPDEVTLSPELISVFPIFDALKVKTKQDAKSVQDFGNGRIDEITTTSYPTFEKEAIDAYSNVRYADGEPLGVAFERDIYSKLPQSEKDKYPDPFDYYKQLVSEHKPAEVITGQNAQALETTDTYRKKQEIETTQKNKEAAYKSGIDKAEYEAKLKLDNIYKPKNEGVDVSSLNAMYSSEAEAINKDESLTSEEKQQKLEIARSAIYGKVYKAFASVENYGKLDNSKHTSDPNQSAFGLFGWLKGSSVPGKGSHLRQAYNQGSVGSGYKNYNEFWKALHNPDQEEYKKTLVEYAQFLQQYAKNVTKRSNIDLADMLAFNLYGKAGVDAYRSGNLNYATDGNMTVGSYVNKGLNAAQGRSSGGSKKEQPTQATENTSAKPKSNNKTKKSADDLLKDVGM